MGGRADWWVLERISGWWSESVGGGADCGMVEKLVGGVADWCMVERIGGWWSR